MMTKFKYLPAFGLLLIGASVNAYDDRFLTDNPLSNTMQIKGVYGKDDRKEYFEVQPAIKKISQSVPALVLTKQLSKAGSNYSLATKKHTEVWVNNQFHDLCKEDSFYNQPTASFCSGVVIDGNKIATAGHCVKAYQQGDACPEISFIFGYQLTDRNAPVTQFAKENVFQCKKVLSKAYKGNTDYAVIEVDRVMHNHPPLAINGNDKIANNEGVSTIGYPSSLPMKITGGATVKANQERDFFTTDLDTFGGNSGSPVFNTTSLMNGEAKVEGLLVRGATDYVPNPTNKNCYITNKCTIQDAQKRNCRGEEVTRISKVKSFAKLIYSRPAVEPLQIKARNPKVKWCKNPTDKTNFCEELKIDLKIPKAGYLNVIEVGPTGVCTVLFPNKKAVDNKVNAGNMTITDDAAWRLIIESGPYGKHQLYAGLSQEPLNLFKEKNQLNKFAPCSVDDLDKLATRGAGAVDRITGACNTRGAGATDRCNKAPLIKSTQVCYFKKPSDCP